MSYRRDPGPLPSRWLKCPRKAADLIIGKFFAFKTPLSENFDDQIPPQYRFTPHMLFQHLKSKKIKIGLWIDLTNTNRFYDKSVVENEDCKYWKLKCRGHGETPSIEQTASFYTYVHNFISKHPLECIAIHCTHGFNRTGFLIISYLVEKMDWSVDVALAEFAKVRYPGIYKGDYIEELYRRYDDIKDAPSPPILPDWCNEFDDGADDIPNSANTLPNFESTSTSSNNSLENDNVEKSKHKRKGEKEFMEGVPGVCEFVKQPKARNLQKKVQNMCGWKSKGFPGSQPVSMNLDNINLLKSKPYRVSWKADGARYMMLIEKEDDIYFIDRDNSIFKVDGLKFPHKKDLHRHLTDTLIDGEMVIDKVEGENIPRYLCYDIIKFENQDVGKMPFFPVRLDCIQNEIINPRYKAMEQGIINKSKEPFSIRNKGFWDITQAHSLLGEKFAKTLSHEPDGLIFQPSNEGYVAGRCDEVLKWKPLNMNSVDFRLKIVKEEGVGIVATKKGHLYVGQSTVPFDQMKYTKDLQKFDNKIVECFFDYKLRQWKFMRERTDKSFPNSYETARAVCASIRDPVTQTKLLEFIDYNRFHEPAPKRPKR